MPDEPTKPIAAGSNMAVETTSVAPETEDTAVQDDDAPECKKEAAALLGDFV